MSEDLRPKIRAAYLEAEHWKRYDRHLWETQGLLVSRAVLAAFVDRWGPVSMLPPDFPVKLVV